MAINYNGNTVNSVYYNGSEVKRVIYNYDAVYHKAEVYVWDPDVIWNDRDEFAPRLDLKYYNDDSRYVYVDTPGNSRCSHNGYFWFEKDLGFFGTLGGDILSVTSEQVTGSNDSYYDNFAIVVDPSNRYKIAAIHQRSLNPLPCEFSVSVSSWMSYSQSNEAFSGIGYGDDADYGIVSDNGYLRVRVAGYNTAGKMSLKQP